MMKAFEQNFGDEEMERHQRDFVDDVVEEGNKNGWFEYEEID